MGLLEALLPSAVMTLLVLTLERQEEINEKDTLLSCHRHLYQKRKKSITVLHDPAILSRRLRWKKLSQLRRKIVIS